MQQMFLEQLARWHRTDDGGRTVYTYRVTKVIGATSPKIGDILTEEQTRDYCGQTGVWKVTITAPKD